MNPNNRLTTNQGAPVGDNQNSRTAGRRGPVLLEDYHLVENWLTLIVNVFQSVLCMHVVQVLTVYS